MTLANGKFGKINLGLKIFGILVEIMLMTTENLQTTKKSFANFLWSSAKFYPKFHYKFNPNFFLLNLLILMS